MLCFDCPHLSADRMPKAWQPRPTCCGDERHAEVSTQALAGGNRAARRAAASAKGRRG